jgi:hypothetical protein
MGEMSSLQARFWTADQSARQPWGLDVLVLYAVDPEGVKAQTWNDGFVAAMRLLSHWGHRVTWVNVACRDAAEALAERAADADVVVAKSNWGWRVDGFLRSSLPSAHSVATAIMVSGVSGHISYRRGSFYDVVFYQTDWYRPRLSTRLVAVHAYGIDTATMYPPPQPFPKEWDWLYVGALTKSRRAQFLLRKSGTRLAIGELSRSDKDVVSALRDDGIVVRDYVPYPELREIYWRSHRLYVPAGVDGGGERQVMEAIACGVEIEVEPDNPKLAEVIAKADLWTERYFARQLELGLYLAKRNRSKRVRS